IDQCPAVANLPPFLDIGQSVPQGQQPLAAERGGVQFLVRSDGNLTLIHCGRRFAAERDSVIADDVDAHGWVLLIDPAAAAAGDPTDALFADQSQSILDNLVALLGQSSPWNCSDPNAVI